MKKFISLVLTLLLVVNMLYIPVFSAETDNDGDIIEYFIPEYVLMDEEFENGGIGENVSGFSSVPAWGTSSTANKDYPSYASLTYEYGIGTNTSNVGMLYDRAYTDAAVTRYNDNGSIDNEAILVTKRNSDTMATGGILSGVSHVITKFKYYHTGSSVKNGSIMGNLNIMHAASNGNRSSTTPTVAISANKATLNYRHNSDTTSGTKTITGLTTNTWYDVTFETIYEPKKAKATSTLTIGDQSVTSFISMEEKPNWAANGYDEPYRLSFFIDRDSGGRYYIDDVKVVNKGVPAETFVDAVEEFTFNNVVAGVTSNLKESIYESWPSGLISSYQRGEDTFEVEWKSSNPGAISPEGVVTRRSYPQKVTLTAKIINSADIYATRTFDVIVAPVEGAPVSALLEDYAKNVITESAFSDEVTENSNKITKDIKPLPTEDDVAGVTIEWDVAPEGYIDVITGQVTRPNYSEQDVEVTLTALISKDGLSTTKDIKYIVVKGEDPNLILENAMNKFTLTVEDYGKLTNNINLPSEYNGVAITWDTSTHSQIDENGTVTRGDAEVTAKITAQFSYGGESRTKEYTLTVLPTVQKMIDIDVELIDKTGWDALTTSFTVPLIGAKYNTVFTWSSTNDYVQVGEGGQITVKRPPNSHSSDLSINLNVNAKLEREQKNISIPIVVLRQADDATTVNQIAGGISFDLIKGANSTPGNVIKKLVLFDSVDSDNDVKISWSSTEENIINPTTGEVIRPLPGQGNAEVAVTAKVDKNYATAYSAPIVVTVTQLSSLDELMQEAKAALTFSVLSSEEIDSVTKNLYLPNIGKYGTTIEWSCDSKFLEFLTISGTEGIVNRPDWDELKDPIVLTAKLSYNDGTSSIVDYKTFNITLAENEVLKVDEVVINENFNSWTNASKFPEVPGVCMWVLPDSVATGTKADIDINPDGSENGVIYVKRNNDIDTSFLTLSLNQGVSSSSVDVNMGFYLPEDFTGTANFDIIASGNAPLASIYFNGADSTIDFKTASDVMLTNTSASFTKGVWNSLRINLNTRAKKFFVYLNGEDIIRNGYVKVKASGENYVTVNGIPFIGSSSAIRGVRWTTSADMVYVDDIHISTSETYTEDHRRAIELWEAEFFRTVDTNCVRDDFNLPKLNIEGMTFTVGTENQSILNTQQNSWIKVYPPREITPVSLYMTFDNGKSAYVKSYLCYVYPKSEVDTSISVSEAVTNDLQTVVDFIEGNYDLTNLKSNINLNAVKVVYGSTITYLSSDENIMTNSGVISKKDKVQKVSLSITAAKGDSTKTKILTIYVGTADKKNNASDGPVGGGGGGGAASKPVYGENTNTQSGIDIAQPEEDNKENHNSASNFKDVAKDHWAYDQINYMVENKIMNGVGDGRIEPERTINREEFVKMLVVALGLDLKDATSDFADVDKNEWYAPYVATIKEKGLINGFEDGTFGIGQNISRQDLAVLIYRSSDLAKEDAKEIFADDSEIADYAKDAVYTLRDLGIINGKGEGKFDPNASATRAETATMLYKAIKAGLFE